MRISRSLLELPGKNNGARKGQRLQGKVPVLSCPVQGMPQDQCCWRAPVTAPRAPAAALGGGSLGAGARGAAQSKALEEEEVRAARGREKRGNAETRRNYGLAGIVLPLLEMTVRSLESPLSPDVGMGRSFSPCPVSCLLCKHQCTRTSCPSYSKCVFWADRVLSMLGKVA